MGPPERVVIQCPSLGPYHLARLRASREAARGEVEIIGLATAGSVAGRPWACASEPAGVRIFTAIPGRVYGEIPGPEAARAVVTALDECRPTLVGVSGYGMADSRAALGWCRRHGAVSILMSESKADDAPRQWWREWLKRRYVARFDAALCGGAPHRRYLEDLGMPTERIFEKYDVVDNEAFSTAAARVREYPAPFRHLPGLGEATPFFLVSSRFIARKNLDLLLRAFGAYRRTASAGWRLVIVGTGAEEATLRATVDREGIPDVVFAGFHQMESLAAYYALAGAFIHPALQEQWGLVVNEAMACRLPVLVSRTVGAAYDLVEEGVNGFTFDPRDEAQLVASMRRISAPDFPLEGFGAASRRIISQWTPEHFAQSFWAAVAAGRQRCARRWKVGSRS